MAPNYLATDGGTDAEPLTVADVESIPADGGYRDVLDASLTNIAEMPDSGVDEEHAHAVRDRNATVYRIRKPEEADALVEACRYTLRGRYFEGSPQADAQRDAVRRVRERAEQVAAGLRTAVGETDRPDGNDDYDVSDTLDALSDDATECGECGHPVVPDATGDRAGTFCPKCGERRDPKGRAPMTDGGPGGAPPKDARCTTGETGDGESRDGDGGTRPVPPGVDDPDDRPALPPGVVERPADEKVTVDGISVRSSAHGDDSAARDARMLAAKLADAGAADAIHRISPSGAGPSVWLEKNPVDQPTTVPEPDGWKIRNVRVVTSGRSAVRFDREGDR